MATDNYNFVGDPEPNRWRVFASVCGWIVAPWFMILLWFIGGPELRKNVADGFRVVVGLLALLFVVAVIAAPGSAVFSAP